MKENSIEEDIKKVENYLENSNINETNSNFFKNGGWEIIDLEITKAMQHILTEYKRVLKENEELKTELKDSVIAIKLYALQTENEKQKKLIEKMKKYLLKENKMCDFLESEE